MTFQAGRSGNPKGRTKGSLNKRTQLAKLLEPHAEQLVAKMIELALGGDATALRLCIERLIPKARHVSTGVDVPGELNERNLSKFKDRILYSALSGQICVQDAEKLIQLVNDRCKASLSLQCSISTTTDPIEASKIYQKIIMSP